MASIAPGRNLAWDCATGNGQAALGLARHFAKVIASDISSEQISLAKPHPRVEYRVSAAESSGLPDKSIDAITVCQALHWLHLPKFFAEVRRVLLPGGVLVVAVYADAVLEDAALNSVLQRFNKVVVGKYWPPQRKLVDERYRSIKFPFDELPTPELAMTRNWNLEELVGYVRSWSATTRSIQATGTDPTTQLALDLADCWGDVTQARRLSWPFTIRACRVAREGS